MARMGVYFEEQVARRYPEFPVRSGRAGLGGISSAAQPAALNELLRGAKREYWSSMTFLEHIFARLERDADIAGARRGSRRRSSSPVTGGELLALVRRRENSSAALRLEAGRSLRADRAEQHSLGALDLAHDGRGTDRGAAVCRGKAPAELAGDDEGCDAVAIVCADASLSLRSASVGRRRLKSLCSTRFSPAPARHASSAPLSSRGCRPGDDHLHLGHVRASRRAWC